MLKITNNNGIFQLTGSLIGQNTNNLSQHMNLLINRKKDIILSLDAIDAIDVNGINVLQKLYKKAISSNVLFYVIGRSNKKISKYLNTTKLQFIVRKDNL